MAAPPPQVLAAWDEAMDADSWLLCSSLGDFCPQPKQAPAPPAPPALSRAESNIYQITPTHGLKRRQSRERDQSAKLAHTASVSDIGSSRARAQDALPFENDEHDEGEIEGERDLVSNRYSSNNEIDRLVDKKDDNGPDDDDDYWADMMLPVQLAPAAPPAAPADLPSLRSLLSDMYFARMSKQGVRELFDWQRQCLAEPSVLAGERNLLYSAPTSGGKTLVSELLVLRALERSRRCLFILPLVALAKEKYDSFRRLLHGTHKRVGGFFGSERPLGGFFEARPRIDLAVCSFEKANTIVTRLLQSGKIGELGCVVVDEVHMVGDGGRGGIVESLLTKLASASSLLRHQGRMPLQLVCMSATMPALERLGAWLDAHVYRTDFRPVSLAQFSVVLPRPVKPLVARGPIRVKCQAVSVATAQQVSAAPPSEPPVGVPGETRELQMKHARVDRVAVRTQLVQEIIGQGKSVLVFSPFRRACVDVARQLQQDLIQPAHDRAAREALAAELAELARQQDGEAALAALALGGIAYHHAGLSTGQREVVERGFRRGLLHTIVATSTLAVGVNLPARRVVIDSPKVGLNLLSKAQYTQMCGRAGRAGKDVAGDSFVLLGEDRAEDMLWLSSVLEAEPPALLSSLASNSAALERIILESVASGLVTTRASLGEYMGRTLVGLDAPAELHERLGQALDALCKRAFLVHRAEDDGLLITDKGSAAVASALAPAQAQAVYDELSRAQLHGIVLEGDMHLIFLCTPAAGACELIDLKHDRVNTRLAGIVSDMDEPGAGVHARVAKQLGLAPYFKLAAIRSGSFHAASPGWAEVTARYRRFYAALVLQRAMDEQPLPTIADEFGVSLDVVRKLMEGAADAAGMIEVFCEALKWHTLQAIFATLRPRLAFGISPALAALFQLDGMTRSIASALHANGVKCAADIMHIGMGCDEQQRLDLLCDIARTGVRVPPSESASQRARRDDILANSMRTIMRSAAELQAELVIDAGGVVVDPTAGRAETALRAVAAASADATPAVALTLPSPTTSVRRARVVPAATPSSAGRRRSAVRHPNTPLRLQAHVSVPAHTPPASAVLEQPSTVLPTEPVIALEQSSAVSPPAPAIALEQISAVSPGAPAIALEQISAVSPGAPAIALVQSSAVSPGAPAIALVQSSAVSLDTPAIALATGPTVAPVAPALACRVMLVRSSNEWRALFEDWNRSAHALQHACAWAPIAGGAAAAVAWSLQRVWLLPAAHAATVRFVKGVLLATRGVVLAPSETDARLLPQASAAVLVPAPDSAVERFVRADGRVALAWHEAITPSPDEAASARLAAVLLGAWLEHGSPDDWQKGNHACAADARRA